MTEPGLTLDQFPETLAVVQLGPGGEVPAWAESSSIFSVTATATETSLVCAARSVPRKARHVRPLTAFAVKGPRAAGPSAVLRALLPLADGEITAFVISTFDTDWLLIPGGQVERAVELWRAAGHEVAAAVPVLPQGKRT